MKSNSTLKQEAREALNGKWETAILVTFILGVIYILCNSSRSNYYRDFPFGLTAVTSLLSIVGFFISGALALSYSSFILKIVRNQNAEVRQSFSGFKNFWKAFLAYLLRNLIILAWCLLILIPLVGGFIYFLADFSFSVTDYNGISESLKTSFVNHGFSMFLIWALLMFLFLLPAIIASIDYAFVFFVLSDEPTIDTLSALDKSKKLMNGYRLKFFLLGLSFIGWMIICVFTLGLGLLLLVPYMYTSYAKFYEERKAELFPTMEETDIIQ